MVRIWAAAFATIALLAGCGQKQDPFGDTDAGIEGEVTYTGHIRPILEASCTRCHAADKQGAERNGATLGVDFDTYQSASQNAEAANPLVQGGAMPPGGESLSPREKALFQAWIDQGLLE